MARILAYFARILAYFVLTQSKMHYGLSKRKHETIAYQFAVENNLELFQPLLLNYVPIEG